MSRQQAASKQQAGGRRWGRTILIAAGAATVVVGGVVLLAPAIASSLAPGMVPGIASGVLNGQASIESASFSWGGPQRITGLKIVDAQQANVASVQRIEMSAGLLGLIGGSLDVGTVTLSGVKAHVVRRPDGTSNVQQLAKSAPQAAAPATSPGATTLPRGVRATLVIDGGDVTVDDQSAGAPGVQVALSDVSLKVAVAEQSPIRVEAKAKAGDARDKASGSVSIDLTIDRWINASGALTPEDATVDATVDVRTLPSAILDAFAGTALAGGSFREGLGSTVDATLRAKGGRSAGDFDVKVTGSNFKADAAVTLAADVLTSRSPVRVEITGAGLAGLSPAAAAASRRDDVRFDALPSVTLEIDKLRLPVPRDGAALDLRGAGAVLTATTSAMKGRVSVEQGAAPRPFAVEPIAMRLDAADLAGSVRLQAATSATIAGERAGDVRADVAVAGLLDAKGEMVKDVPGSVQGSVSLKGVATAIAQPLAGKLNLSQDVGPVLDASVRVATVQRAQAGDAPTLDVDLTIDSRNIGAGASIRASKDRVVSREGGVRVAVRNPASIASRFMDPAMGFVPSPSRPDSKGLAATIANLDVAIRDGKPRAAELAADIEATIDGFSLVPLVDGKPGAPLDVASLRTSMSLAKGNLKGRVNGSVWHESRPATIDGAFEVTGMLANDATGAILVDVANLEPKGSVSLKDLPASIVRLAKAGTTTPAGSPPALDLVKLLQGVAGETFTITADAAAGNQASREQTFTVGVRSSRLRADVAGRRTARAIELSTLGAQLDVQAATIQSLTEAFAPDVKGLPRLASPAALTLETSPFAVPLKADGSLDLAAAGMLMARATLPGRTLVTGLTRQDATTGKPVDLGPVGVENVVIDANVALAGLAVQGRGDTTVRMTGSLLGGEGARAIASLESSVSTAIAGGMPTGPLRTKVDVTKIDVAALERLAGREPVAAEAIGETATVRLAADVQPAPAKVKGGSPDYAGATTAVTMQVDAPRLKSDGPLAATISPAAIRLDKPSRFTMSPQPGLVNGFLKPAKGEASMQVQEISPVTLTLDRLSLPLKGAAGTSTPLAAQARIALERLAMRGVDGRDMRLSGIDVSTTSREAGAAGTSIDFVAKVAQADAGEGAKASAMQIAGSLDGLLDANGAIDPSRATVSVRSDLPTVPTALIDALTTRDGLAVDALGPVAAFKLDVDRFPLGDKPAGGGEGLVSVTATSARATASFKGVVRDGVLAGVEPVQASVTELSRDMGGRFIDGLPMLGSFEKTAQDLAASLRVTDLTLPLSKDFSKLNAEVTFDPGEARFEASPEFAELLKLVNARGAGVIGRKLEPLKVHVKQGVATYDSWTLPLGEFRVRTEGTVDLVRQSMDVVTYVPIEALSDKALSSLKSGTFAGKVLPGVADALREVPLRTKGPLGAAGTSIDFELVAKNAVKGLDAEKLIQEGLDKLFKPRQPK